MKLQGAITCEALTVGMTEVVVFSETRLHGIIPWAILKLAISLHAWTVP
jgi:hypothetical protein